MIRLATIHDLGRITDIYNQAIESRNSVGDTEILTVPQRESWFYSHSSEHTPLFVHESGSNVDGYAYLSEYRLGRPAFKNIAEIGYFVDFQSHRQGIGGRLVQHCIHNANELGYKHLLAILLGCNTGSIALLEKYGFELWGALPDVACIDDTIYSHCYYGLKL